VSVYFHYPIPTNVFKRMPKIIVMNIGIEDMIGYGLTDTQYQFTETSSNRNVWFIESGDVILSRFPIEYDFLCYVSSNLGFDSNSISIITPLVEIDGPLALTDDLLLQPNIILQLEKIIGGNPSWIIFPCFFTPGVAELNSRLGLYQSIGLQFALQCGIELLNRKTHFRQFAIGTGLPLSEGFVVHSLELFKKAIRQLLPNTGIVIVKRDNGAASMGNITITTKNVIPLPGSRETRSANEDLDTLASEIWDQLTDKWNQVLVVESYHNATERFYLEYLIEDDGKFNFLNSGDILLRKDSNPASKQLFWVGLEIPATISSFFLVEATTIATRFINLASKMGYRGLLNIDVILTEKNKLIFNEVNARWGGCSVMHCIGERLLGSQYSKNYVLSSRREVGFPSFQETLQILKENGLEFDRSSNHGVIILASGHLATSISEFLLIGESPTKVSEIISALFTTFDNHKQGLSSYAK